MNGQGALNTSAKARGHRGIYGHGQWNGKIIWGGGGRRRWDRLSEMKRKMGFPCFKGVNSPVVQLSLIWRKVLNDMNEIGLRRHSAVFPHNLYVSLTFWLSQPSDMNDKRKAKKRTAAWGAFSHVGEGSINPWLARHTACNHSVQLNAATYRHQSFSDAGQYGGS